MQKARSHTGQCRSICPWCSHCLQADGFRYYFTPLAGVLFTFPSRYWFTIGCRVVFSLVRRSSQIPAGFHVSRGTRVSDPERRNRFAYGAITRSGAPFQALLLRFCFVTFRQFRKTVRSDPSTPHMQRFRAITHMRFGLFPFRSPLLRKSLLFSFPGVT